MSHNSPRSLRVKQEARARPDAIHKNQAVQIQPSPPKPVLSGGSELSQLIQTSDSLQAAMRKIVQ